MSSIGSVQQIVATIRAEMAARITPGERLARAAQLRQASQTKVGSLEQRQQRMGNLIGQRVKALDPDDPKRGKKAFRIFLESVLLAELGETLINDPDFYQMVDDVQQTMEQDPQIADAIGKAVSILLNPQTNVG
jgi:hypothetical protein